jgi:hypothetical protein
MKNKMPRMKPVNSFKNLRYQEPGVLWIWNVGKIG